MPAVHFDIEWPDDTVTTHYSPSTVVREYFQVGERLTISTLLERSEQAMSRASDRVVAKFGFACSSAMDTRAQIAALAEKFSQDATVRVRSVS
jgi:uncharacterized repeat protein (TIGR04042 family)